MSEFGVGSSVGGKASNQQSVDRNEDTTNTAPISYKSLVITH